MAFHRALGEKRWHLASKVPIVDSHGTVTGIVGIARDIRERKQAEETLRQERILLRTVVDNLPGLIFFKDNEGQYLLNDQQHLRSIGAKQQEDVLGKTTFDFNPHEPAELYTKDEREVVRTGKTLFNVEERALHRDTGEERWHLTSKVPVVDCRGMVTGVVGIASDITDRKRADADREKLIQELQSAPSRCQDSQRSCPDLCKLQKDQGRQRILDAARRTFPPTRQLTSAMAFVLTV